MSNDSHQEEAVKLRDAIRRAGFAVMETSGDWSIHDVSELGKARDDAELETANRIIDIELENTSLSQRVAVLENAIRTHRNQRADDRCIFDDDALYEALGDGIKCDRHVGDQAAMLRNCERFIKNRTLGGKWASYAELELDNGRLNGELAACRLKIAELENWIKASPAREVAFRYDTQQFGVDALATKETDKCPTAP